MAELGITVFAGHSEDKEPKNHGRLIPYATCAPADIRYSNDLRLMKETRKEAEQIIDTLHKPAVGVIVKPRTYRERAHKEYLAVDKQRKTQKNNS